MSDFPPASSPAWQSGFLAQAGLENILQLLPMAVYCCDLEGNIVYYNQQASEVWGRSPDQGEDKEKYCGSYKLYNLDGSYLPHPHCPMGKAILERLPFHQGEIIIERPDHSRVYAKAHIRLLTDENGQIIGAVNCLKDVSSEKQLQQAYQTITENFRLLAEHIPQLVWIADQTGELLYYNPQWLVYTGLSPAMLQLKEWWQGVHPQELALLQEKWQQSVQSLAPFTVTIRLQRGADQAYRWFLVQALPFRSQSGESLRWLGTCTDIDEQKETEEALRRSQQHLEDFVENANIGLHWVSQEGVIIWANQAEYQLLGYTREEYIGLPIAQVHVDAPVIEDILRRLSGKEQLVDRPARLRCKDGSIKQVLINSSVFWQGEQFMHTRCFTRDVTEKHQAEQQLKEKNQALQQVNQQLLTINNQLDTFVYAASHDLKAPILNLEGLFKSLLRQLPPASLEGEKISKTIAFIHQSVDRFKQTITQLTDIAKLQQEASQDAVLVDITPILARVREEVAPLIEESNAWLEVDVSPDSQIHFSPRNLQSILYNLLSNALKYRSPERVPLIRISCHRQPGYQVLTVQDNGLGMDMSQEEKIFALFKRLHDHVEGSGIGLYIVRKMVENAAGRIEVESQPGVGSTFRVYFRQ